MLLVFLSFGGQCTHGLSLSYLEIGLILSDLTLRSLQLGFKVKSFAFIVHQLRMRIISVSFGGFKLKLEVFVRLPQVSEILV